MEARKGRGHLAWRGGRTRQRLTPARGRSQPQPGTDGRGGCRCISGRAPFSALGAVCSAPGVRRERSLPEARGWRAGLAPHCGSGCGPWWARRGRVGCASSHSHPRFFSSPNARCHLFAVCHLFTVPCQAGWLGFGGQGRGCH